MSIKERTVTTKSTNDEFVDQKPRLCSYPAYLSNTVTALVSEGLLLLDSRSVELSQLTLQSGNQGIIVNPCRLHSFC